MYRTSDQGDLDLPLFQMSNRERARQLYKPPFRYENGYIMDAQGEMVADRQESMLRVRGWGRISRMGEGLDAASALQDAVGELIAEILTKGWAELSSSHVRIE